MENIVNYCKNNLNTLTSVILRDSKTSYYLTLQLWHLVPCWSIGARALVVLAVTTEIICSVLNPHSEWTRNWKYVFFSISPFLQAVLQLWLGFNHMSEQETTNTSLVCQPFLLLLKEEKGRSLTFSYRGCTGSSELVRAKGDGTFSPSERCWSGL